MKHTVKLHEIMPAIEAEIILARSTNKHTKHKKKLYFYPLELTFWVSFDDENTLTTSSYRRPKDAVDKYNELDA